LQQALDCYDCIMSDPQDEAILNASTAEKGIQSLADEAVQRCMRIVANCNRFKQPRLDRIQLYRDLYAGKVKKKFRQPFNVVLPVFSGLIDTLQAQFNDDPALEFEEQERVSKGMLMRPPGWLPGRPMGVRPLQHPSSEVP